ncbi:tRNA pseudouridine(55) synthase TruB [soil metagenome]
MARQSRAHTGPEGLVVVDKPPGWTSHDVVARSRGLLGTRKVGHAGTLDPDATGVLLLGVGRATRLLRYLSPLPKAYVGEIVLGTETSTLDAAGDVTATHDMSGITLTDLRRVSEGFLGDIEQIPPMVSAVKVDGRRLHELARKGIEVERRPRPVTVHAMDIDDGPGEPGVFGVSVSCSSGTYVRTLAADLGAALGGGAHLRALRRTSVGPFTLDEAVALDAVGPEQVRPPLEAVRHLARVVVDEQAAAAVAVGKVLERSTLGGGGDGPWAVADGHGSLLAVYEPFRGSTTKPSVVLPGQTDTAL